MSRYVIDDIKKCTGCFACKAVCPADAIFVQENDRGHLYPRINIDKCIGCGKCKDICPSLNPVLENGEQTFFAVRHNNPEILKKSASGGLFSGLAEVIFSRGGVCYGASYCEDFSVAHKRAASMEELSMLRGSKYAMSDTKDTFKSACEDLEKGRTVLYSGTSCIVAGLYSYLKERGTDIKNLYTCDLVCAGVPGGKFLKEYIGLLSKKHKSKCVRINLKDKNNGWGRGKTLETYEFENGERESNQVYRELYKFRVLHRENCFNCPYVKLSHKPSDITMGDFWGVSEEESLFNDGLGCSLAIVSSSRGRELLEDAKLRTLRLSSEREAMDKNRTAQHEKIRQHDRFKRDLNKKGFQYCLKKYTSSGGTFAKIRRKILMLLKRW